MSDIVSHCFVCDQGIHHIDKDMVVMVMGKNQRPLHSKCFDKMVYDNAKILSKSLYSQYKAQRDKEKQEKRIV